MYSGEQNYTHRKQSDALITFTSLENVVIAKEKSLTLL